MLLRTKETNLKREGKNISRQNLNEYTRTFFTEPTSNFVFFLVPIVKLLIVFFRPPDFCTTEIGCIYASDITLLFLFIQSRICSFLYTLKNALTKSEKIFNHCSEKHHLDLQR